MKTITRKKEKIKKNLKDEKIISIIESVSFFALGFILSMSTVLKYASPFSISLISVSKKNNFVYTAIGSALGYLVFCPDSFARYGIAVVIVTLGTFAIIISDVRNSPLMPMIISFLSLAVTGFVVNLKTGSAFAEYALTFGESVLGLCGAFFFYRTINCNFKRFRFKALPISDLTCIIISASLVLISLSHLTIGGISPIRVIAVMLILLVARFGSDKLGLILALSLGFALGISNENSIFLVGGYGFSALLSVLFSPFGNLGVGLSFFLSMSLFSIASSNENAIYFAAEALISSIIFILLPQVVTSKVETFFHDSSDVVPDGSLRQSLVVRLRFASNAMNHISESVNEVREKINDINSQKGIISKEGLTEEEYITREIINEKTNEIRMVASDQFFSIADMLMDLAREFDEAEHFDNISAGKIRRMLGEYDIFPKNISVIEDKYARVRIEIMTKGREVSFSNPKITNEISKICNRYFEKGRVTHFNNDTMISFSEKPNYSIDIGFAQHSAEGSLCGDTIKIVNDGKGHSVLIISDGMGRGGRAALDGAMGAGLLSTLLTAGFGFDSALKVVNSALLVKSNEESLATLDCASVDLFTGRVDFYKAGAPASYIIKGNKVTKCELTSMPAGILRGIEFAKRTAVLSDNDIVVLTSDGITELGGEWISALFTGFEDMTPQEIADTILKEALNIAKGTKEDDMSVIVAQVNRM